MKQLQSLNDRSFPIIKLTSSVARKLCVLRILLKHMMFKKKKKNILKAFFLFDIVYTF